MKKYMGLELLPFTSPRAQIHYAHVMCMCVTACKSMYTGIGEGDTLNFGVAKAAKGPR